MEEEKTFSQMMKVIEKEESLEETVVTTLTATAVDTFEESAEVEEDGAEDTDETREGKERMEVKGGEEEEEGRAKKLTGPWESEVRT